MLYAVVGLTTLFIIADWLCKYLGPPKAEKARKILKVVFYCLLCVIVGVMVYYSVETKDYWKGTLIILIILLPYIKSLVGWLYKKYDQWVDNTNGRV